MALDVPLRSCSFEPTDTDFVPRRIASRDAPSINYCLSLPAPAGKQAAQVCDEPEDIVLLASWTEPLCFARHFA